MELRGECSGGPGLCNTLRRTSGTGAKLSTSAASTALPLAAEARDGLQARVHDALLEASL